VFLTEALRYFGGAAARVMIDNTHVVVLRGSGSDMVPVPEMAAFGNRFGFQFVAHAIGNANRSARVKRPFWFIESNFLAGSTFCSWEDLSRRAQEWCDKVNSTYKKHIRAVPREPFAVERLHLKPLPVLIPEVYRLQQRLVDIEGYVALTNNRYSVPVDWIGRRVEVRETKDKIEIQLDARRLVTHRRIAEADYQRVMLAEHRPPRGHRDARPDRSVEFLVRAKHNRNIAEDPFKLWEAVRQTPVRSQVHVRIPRQSARPKKGKQQARAKRPARNTDLTVRFMRVQLRPADTPRCRANSRGKSTERRPSPGIGPGKRNLSREHHRNNGPHTSETRRRAGGP
jgi:hypothetical protein